MGGGCGNSVRPLTPVLATLGPTKHPRLLLYQGAHASPRVCLHCLALTSEFINPSRLSLWQTNIMFPGDHFCGGLNYYKIIACFQTTKGRPAMEVNLCSLLLC